MAGAIIVQCYIMKNDTIKTIHIDNTQFNKFIDEKERLSKLNTQPQLIDSLSVKINRHTLLPHSASKENQTVKK